MSTGASITGASVFPTPVPVPVRAAVTVLTGLRTSAVAAVAGGMLAADPAVVLVRHRLDQGSVRRVVRTRDAVLEDERVPLRHGCLSCTLREDLLPALVRLGRADPGRDLVLMLPEVVEPAAVAGACAYCLVDGDPVTRWLRFDSYLAVVDGATVLDDLATGDELADRGMQAAAGDERGVAEVLARQVEFADTVLLWEDGDHDLYQRLRRRLLVHRLAPWAVHLTVDAATGCQWTSLRGTARHQPETPDPVARALEGYELGVHDPAGDCGVVSVEFRARRPMHPGRLYDTMRDLPDEALRSRGHVWLAAQPDLVVGWEAAGGRVTLGSLGQWLAAVAEADWNQASQSRRIAASLAWDPYYGDRGNHLVFVGVGLDPADLHRRLAACLLTDAELAAGQDAWRDLPDPFAGCFPPGSDTSG